MKYITYNHIHRVFETITIQRSYLDPPKFGMFQVSSTCWTTLNKAQVAISDALGAQIMHLRRQTAMAESVADTIYDWSSCDHCLEPVPHDDVNGFPPEADQEWLCKTCYDVAMEN